MDDSDAIVRTYAAVVSEIDQLERRQGPPRPNLPYRPATYERPSQRLAELRNRKLDLVMRWQVLGRDYADLEEQARSLG